MKKLFALVLTLALVLCCAAVAENEFNPEWGSDPGKDAYYFIFIPKLVHPYYDKIEEGITDKVAEYAEKGINITWDWDAPAEANAVVQSEKIQNAAAKNPDCLCISVQDPNVIDPIIHEVTEAGIPVATFTDNSNGTDYLAFAGIEDFYSHGVQLGEALAEKMEYKGQVAMLVGTLDATPHIARTQGIKDALAQYPDIEIVAEQADNDSLEEAVNLTEQLINTYPDLKAITSSDGSAAAGASIAVRGTDKAGKLIIVGFDAIDETLEGLRDGTIYATQIHDTYQIGQYIVPMMIEIADGKMTETTKAWVDVGVMTKDDMVDFGY